MPENSATTETITVRVEAGVATVTLNRPDSMNTLNQAMANRWLEVTQLVTVSPEVDAIVLRAEGRAFCAGGDLAAMADLGYDGQALTKLANTIHAGMLTLRGGRVPIVAEVQGVVAGGGLGVMLAADVIVASDRAKFFSRYAQVGLTPDCGVTTFLTESVGMRRALLLSLTDLGLSAAEALDWGLISEVVPPEQLRSRVREIATEWSEGASAAFGEARWLMRVAPSRSFKENLQDEAHTIGAAIETQDARSRIEAFLGRSARPDSAQGR